MMDEVSTGVVMCCVELVSCFRRRLGGWNSSWRFCSETRDKEGVQIVLSRFEQIASKVQSSKKQLFAAVVMRLVARQNLVIFPDESVIKREGVCRGKATNRRLPGPDY